MYDMAMIREMRGGEKDEHVQACSWYRVPYVVLVVGTIKNTQTAGGDTRDKLNPRAEHGADLFPTT